MSSLAQEVTQEVTVTVNQRLARELTAHYSAQQLAAGKQAWDSPQILPWNGWLTELWHSLSQILNQNLNNSMAQQPTQRPLLLLTRQQAGVIWEDIIRQSPAANGLLQVAETARVAKEAWQLLHAWEIPLQQLDQAPGTSTDVKVFFQWAKSYQQRLMENSWLDPDQQLGKLIAACQIGQIVLPTKLRLAGYADWSEQATPQQQHFVKVIEAQGCRVEWIAADQRTADKFAGKTTNIARLACADREHEIHITARHCRYLLEQATVNNHRQIKIGVVVPDLNQRKARISAVFEDTLGASSVHFDQANTHTTNSLVNLSLGDPLSTNALIKTAFLILNAAAEPLPLEELSRLIRSPYILAAEKEMSTRALLDAHLRQTGENHLSLKLLISVAKTQKKSSPEDKPIDNPQAWNCPLLVSALEQFCQLTEQHNFHSKRSVVEWLKLFDSLLDTLGWPGERTLNSDEYQTVEAWRNLREEFVGLDRVSGPVSFTTALHLLQKVASDKVFQPQAADVPIQIMGILEATGLQFDHLLLMGMTDEQWPQKPAANPFLPYALQRQKKMPHASAERELSFARTITEQLLQSAPDILVSFPQSEGDQPFRPSPLIADLPEVAVNQIGLSDENDLYKRILESGNIEQLVDNQARSLSEGQNIKGGSGIFKDQAACPFRTFVKHRLRTDLLGAAEAGLNPAERGSLVHAALEILWGQLQSQENLSKLSADQLDECIASSTQKALDEFRTAKTIPQAPPFQSLEITRLQKLLKDWLQIELGREPFTVVAREEPMEVTLAGIRINTRVDRIDQLAGGELAVIDYKTGNPNTNDWSGERPEDPQLPLYASCKTGQAPQAVLFAKLKKGEQAYSGVMDNQLEDQQLGKRVKPSEQDWAELISQWHITLEDLARQFMQGHALVDPKEIGKTCQYCDLQSLCRIDELTDIQGAEPDD